jgi:hypothetical protein
MERGKKRLLCVIQIVRNNHEPCAQGQDSHGVRKCLSRRLFWYRSGQIVSMVMMRMTRWNDEPILKVDIGR